MEDKITIKVKELIRGQEKWMEYNLSYEEFAEVYKILSKCEDKKECPVFDSNDPQTSVEMFAKLMLPFNQQKGIMYNIKEKPKDKSIEEVIDYYNRHNILLVEGDNIQTKQML